MARSASQAVFHGGRPPPVRRSTVTDAHTTPPAHAPAMALGTDFGDGKPDGAEASQRASPRAASPRAASPRLTPPRLASRRLASPRATSPRLAPPCLASRRLASRAASPRLASPPAASPRLASPRAASPRLASRRLASRRLASPPAASTRLACRLASRRLASRRLASPRAASVSAARAGLAACIRAACSSSSCILRCLSTAPCAYLASDTADKRWAAGGCPARATGLDAGGRRVASGGAELAAPPNCCILQPRLAMVYRRLPSEPWPSARAGRTDGSTKGG